MTDTTTDIEASTEPAPPLRPADILMSLIVALLAPMFLTASAGDIALARMAALETINAYRARNAADLIAVAQIVAFGLAALGSLSLSLADDISINMALRLRGNANACNRSAERNRRALTESHTSDPTPDNATTTTQPTQADSPLPASDPFLSPAAEQLLAAEANARLTGPEQTAAETPPTPVTAPATTEKRHQKMWAIAMMKEASEINAAIPNLPPEERRTASIRAAMLSSTAHDLLSGAPMPPPLKPGALAHITRSASI
jgi:hypothetical protein